MKFILDHVRASHLTKIGETDIIKKINTFIKRQKALHANHGNDYSDVECLAKIIEKNVSIDTLSEDFVYKSAFPTMFGYFIRHSYVNKKQSTEPKEIPLIEKPNLKKEKLMEKSRVNSMSPVLPTRTDYTPIVLETLLDVLLAAVTFIFLLPITPFIAIASTYIHNESDIHRHNIVSYSNLLL